MTQIGLVKKYELGDVIMTSSPYAQFISMKCNGDYCDSCGKPPNDGKKLLRCTNCQYETYCNRVCQKKSWAFHKFECGLLKATSPKIPSDSLRLFTKLVWLETMPGFTPSDGRCISDLCSNVDQIRLDPLRSKQFAELMYSLVMYVGEDTLQKLHPSGDQAKLLEIFGKMTTNTITITHMNKEIGAALYLNPSQFNHSCFPNASCVFEGVEARIVALRDIDLLTEEVTLNYIDPFFPFIHRQNDLSRDYFFTCQCVRCHDVELTRRQDSFVCPECSGDVLTKDSHLQCVGCEKTEFDDDFSLKCRRAQSEADKIITAKPDVNVEQALDFVKKNFLLSDSNIRTQLMKSVKYDHLCRGDLLKEAIELGVELESIYDSIYPPYFPTIGIHKFKQGRNLWNNMDYERCCQYLIEARRLLLPSYGNEHSLIRTIEEEIMECRTVIHMKESPVSFHQPLTALTQGSAGN